MFRRARLLLLSGVVVFAVLGASTVAATSAEAAIAAEQQQARIVGGAPLTNGEMPFLVALGTASGQQFCGGSLIDALWILTASHCLEGLTAADVVVGVGDVDLGQQLDVIPAAELIMHPNFNFQQAATNDIALIRLERPADLTAPTVGLVTLNTDDVAPIVGDSVTVAGWGDRDGHMRKTDYPQVAHHVAVDVLACDGRYGGESDATHVCAIGDGTDSCQGDSGGPLVLEIGGEWIQVGTVESGPPDGSCAAAGTYGVYQRVSPHLDWLREVSGLPLGQPELIGDVNCDGEVSLLDAREIAQMAIGALAAYECGAEDAIGDADFSGLVGLGDARLIAQCAVGAAPCPQQPPVEPPGQAQG